MCAFFPVKKKQAKKKKVYHTEQIRKKCTDETPDQTSEKHLQICTVSTVNLEKIDLNQYSPVSISKVAFVVFFIQYLMVAVE